MKIRSKIILFTLISLVIFSAGCKGRKNRCATCPTWSAMPIETEQEKVKG